MELTRIRWEENEGVGVATINRPERLNALDLRTIIELDMVMERAQNIQQIRCVVVTGNGRAFSAGADVKEWSSGNSEQDEGADDWTRRAHAFMSRLYHLPKPVIAAVNGVAVGAGCDLALVADLRIASTNARFGEAYINVGFSPDAGGSFLLPRLIGPTRAAEMIFTGRIIDAQEANQIGLLNQLVEPEELLPATMELARKLAGGPTVAIGLAKENMHRNAFLGFEEALAVEHRAGSICGATADHREGLRAVVEKRKPIFQGH